LSKTAKDSMQVYHPPTASRVVRKECKYLIDKGVFAVRSVNRPFVVSQPGYLALLTDVT